MSPPIHAEETRPLLPEPTTENGQQRPITNKGLPKPQIATLLLSYFAETIIAVFAYPFLAQLIGSLDVVQENKGRVGYFMGALDSVGHLTTAIAVLLWGKFSDGHGRKPVLLACSAGLAIAITGFGFSKTYQALVLCKFLEGLFKANKPTVKTAFAELSEGDESKMAKAFALMPVVYAAGAAAGPFIGGTFSQPCERFPNVYLGQFWREYPYLLPCLAAASCCAIAFLVTLVVFKETLPSLHAPRNPDSRVHGSVGSLYLPSDAFHDSELQSHIKNTSLPPRPLIIVLANYAVFVFLDVSFVATFALFLSSPISMGGLAFSPHAIGIVLGFAGIFHGLFQAFFFARIHRCWELRNVYAVSIAAYIPIYLCMPTMNALAKRAGRIIPLVWILLVLVEMACTFAYTAFSCMYIFITLASPSPAALGRTHATAQTVFSLSGAIGPACVTSLVAASLQYNLLGGSLGYIVMAAVGFVALALASLLPANERQRHIEPHT